MLGAAGAALLVGAVLAVLRGDIGSLRHAGRETTRANAVLAASAGAQKSVLDVETGLRGYVITGEPRFLAPFRTGSVAALRRTARLARLVDSPVQRARARRLRAAVDDYLHGYAAPLVRQATARPSRAQSLRATTEGKRRLDAIRSGFAAFDRMERNVLAHREAEAQESSRVATRVSDVTIVLLPLLVVGFALLVWRTIALPVRRLAEATERVRAGDLATRAPAGGVGEIGALGEGFDAMTQALDRARATSAALLDALFVQAPMGVAFFDPEGRFVRLNPALAETNGVPLEEHVGRRMADVAPQLAGDAEPLLRRALDGERVAVEVAGETPARPGQMRRWASTWFPVRGPEDEVLGAGLVVEEVTARRRLEEAERASAQRTAALQTVTAALSRAVSEDEVLDAILGQGLPALGADAGVVLLGREQEGRLESRRAAGVPPIAPLDLDDDRPVAEAVRGGRARFFESRERLLERYPDLPFSAHESRAVLPLGVPSDGALVLAYRQRRAFTADDRAFLAAFAAQSGQALERARLYEAQRRIAVALQRSLLPAALPDAPGLRLGARYRPAGEGLEVGGDFYDVVDLGGGRWLVVVGDVCGKGPEAAALTGVVRHTLRAEAMHLDRPGEMLALLDGVVAREGAGRFVTAAVGVLDGDRLTLAVAGHPRPLVLRDGAGVEAVGARGDLLGVLPDAEFPEAEVTLAEGDTLVLYTDGLLDARAPAVLLTLDDVADDLAGWGGAEPESLLDHLEDLALGGETQPPRDDITLLVVSRPPGAG